MDYREIKLKTAKHVLEKILSLSDSNIKSFIIYGSVATDSVQEFSDIDIMLLTDYHDMSLLQKVKNICEEFQISSKQEISLSFNTVSSFLSHIMQGHQMYINVCVKGSCLMSSKVFEGLQKIIKNSSLPSKEEISTHVRGRLEIQSKHFLGRSMTDFVATIDAIVRGYIHLKEFESTEVDTWVSYEDLINHNDFFPLIEKHLQTFAPVLKSFYKTKNTFKPIKDVDTSGMENLDLKKLTDCILYIENETSK